MGTNANIINIKPQGIYVADVATALPTITGTLGETITMTGWTDLGFVDPEGNIKIKFEAESRVVRAMGHEGDLKAFKTSQRAIISFTNMEEVIENIQRNLNVASVSSSNLGDGGSGEIGYKALAIVTTKLVYHFKRVGNVEGLELEIDDTQESKIPFVLQTFIEEAATAGERQWKIHTRTAD